MMSQAARTVLGNQRVLFVNQELEMGGAERQALYLARYLQEEIGSEVHFWGLSQPGLALEQCREWGLQCRLVPFDWGGGPAAFASGAFEFLAECRKLRPTVILPYTHPPNVLCGLTWRTTGARVCIWNQRDAGLQRSCWPAERLATMATPFFVSNSVAGANFLVNSLGVQRTAIRVVRNGVSAPDVALARERGRRAFGIPGNSLVACMVANLHDGKDHETLIKAWSRVRTTIAAHGHESMLVLVGRDYGKQDKLAKLAADLGLSSRDVRFAGQMRNPEHMLTVVDLCVHSTKSEESEGSPNAVLEAMSLGLAVVGTDVATMREVLGEDCGCCLSELGNVEALAGRICQFLLNEELRQRVGQHNRRRISRLYSLDAMCTRMADLIVASVQDRQVAW